MNIFYVDRNPQIAAESLFDKHVVKMTLETAQLLCTTHHELGSTFPDQYRPTHRNHPCAIWARQSAANYYWLYDHFASLAQEFTYRYGKTHLSYTKLADHLSTAPLSIPASPEFSEPPLAMPDDIRREYYSDHAHAYRKYYLRYKRSLCSYTRRTPPDWVRVALYKEPGEHDYDDYGLHQ